jgi:hypothetical protein
MTAIIGEAMQLAVNRQQRCIVSKDVKKSAKRVSRLKNYTARA